MRVIRILPLVAMLLCAPSLSASAGEPPPAPEWDAVLDGIYAHTWRGRAELDAELRKEEARIKQDLAGYLAAWERRMAAPIVYTDKSREGGACGPLTYCAADINDPRGLILRLQEKKGPLARFIFDKLSAEARKAISECDLGVPGKGPSATTGAAQGGAGAVKGPPAEVARLLADELGRVVRDDSIYDQERFAGVRLSFAALSLINAHNDPANRVCANKTLLADAFPGELARNFKCGILKDEAYRRVVAARTVQYLRSGDKKTLDEGITLSEKFEDKLMYTDFAFWYYYPRMLADVRVGDSAALTYDAYGVLNNAVLGGEPGKTGPEEVKRRNYGWNLADVVLSRGITAGRMEGLEALGSAVWLLGNRSGTQSADPREQEIGQLIADVRKFLAGPESDNFRLNYAIAMREGERRRALLVRALDAKESGPSVERLFKEARDYLKLACEWAWTGQGRTTASTSYLELVNLALARMKDILPQATYADLAANPGKVNADTAALLYRVMAERENGGWEQLRFIDRKGYIDGAQRLWNALRRNAILVGDYHLRKMDPDDFQSAMDNADPAERALLGYAHLFEEYTANGYREIVPDSAYFAYAETLKMLSRLKKVVSSYNNSMDLHNQSLDYLARGIAVYPYDGGISEYVAGNRNINADFNNLSPASLIARIAANGITAKCLEETGKFCDNNAREILAWNIYKVRNGLSDKNDDNRLNDMKLLAKNWQESIPVTVAPARDNGRKGPRGGHEKKSRHEATPKVTVESQRAALYRLCERYIALAEQLAALTSDAGKRLDSCRAGEECEGARDAADNLLVKRDEAEKVRKEFVSQCGLYRQMPGNGAGNAGSGKELEYLAGLVTAAAGTSFQLTDRIIAVTTRHELSELRRKDNHPMHKVLKSAYYATR